MAGPPASIAKDARACRVWSEVAHELEACDLLTVLDLQLLALFCKAISRYWEAEEFLDQHGLMYVMRDPPLDPTDKKDKGRIRYMQQYPQVGIATKYLALARGYAAELGLSPAARSRIQLPEGAGGGMNEDERRILG